ncbi:MAG: hypothetical protein GJT30_03790 [Geobacter sp.]|nr:hypothetical protein [Geobacter sp.]
MDILVALSSQKLFNQAIDIFGFKKILSPPGKQFPNLEDYLGFDLTTGTLIHLHVHYALVLGEKFIKNHHLPLESLFFRHLIPSSQGLWIPCPELELIVLVLRAHMKTDLVSLAKHQIKDFLGHSYIPFPDNIKEEFDELIKCSDLDKARLIYRESRLPLHEDIVFGFIRELSEGSLRARSVALRKIQILHGLRGYQRQNNFAAYGKYIGQYIQRLPLLARFIVSKKKTFCDGGKVFAVVGADGAGKSTLIGDLEAWLSWKVIVKRTYYGIPKSSVIQMGFWIVQKLEKLSLNHLSKELNALLWLIIAHKRFVTAVKAQALAAKGILVLSDRFPMKDFHKMTNPMDGPRLFGSNSWFSQRESLYYQNLVYPNRIFVLKVAFDELRKRKTDLPLDIHMLKAEAVNSITEREGIIIVDANRSYEEVLLQIKTLIWQELVKATYERGK